MGRIETALKMARCAEINLENLGKRMPLVVLHHRTQAIYKIVDAQIKDCIKALEDEEATEDGTDKD